MKWEYTCAVAKTKAFTKELFVDGAPIEEFLDEMGRQGWELTASPTITSAAVVDHHIHLIFKAPLED